MDVQRTTEMMTRGMAVGNCFKVCFRVTGISGGVKRWLGADWEKGTEGSCG
jgi:hypothetical protein